MIYVYRHDAMKNEANWQQHLFAHYAVAPWNYDSETVYNYCADYGSVKMHARMDRVRLMIFPLITDDNNALLYR